MVGRGACDSVSVLPAAGKREGLPATPTDAAQATQRLGTLRHPPHATIKDCLTSPRAPPTPEGYRHYRRGVSHPVGEPARPPARAHDLPPPTDRTYGVVHPRVDTAAGCLTTRAAPPIELPARVQTSEVREPLGRAPPAPYALPAAVQRPGFAFGQPNPKGEGAKSVMYPATEAQMSPRTEAEHQLNRNYDWTRLGINPATHRFGAVRPPNDAPDASSPTKVVAKGTEDARAVRAGAGGVAAATRRGYAPLLPESHVFGRRPEPDVCDVAALLRGASGSDSPGGSDGGQARLDGSAGSNGSGGGGGGGFGASHSRGLGAARVAVGKASTRSVTQLRLKEADVLAGVGPAPTQTFGSPSQRRDRPPPDPARMRIGVADSSDTSTAGQCLWPAGLSNAFGAPLRSSGEARALAERCRFGLSEAEVEEAFEAARRMEPTPYGVSPQAFMRAVHVTAP